MMACCLYAETGNAETGNVDGFDAQHARPPKDQKAAEEALTKLLREANIASDRCTDMARSDALRAAGPSGSRMRESCT